MICPQSSERGVLFCPPSATRDGEVEGYMQNEGQRKWRADWSGDPLSTSSPPYLHALLSLLSCPPIPSTPGGSASLWPPSLSLSTIWVLSSGLGTGDREIHIHSAFIHHLCSSPTLCQALIIRPPPSRNLSLEKETFRTKHNKHHGSLPPRSKAAQSSFLEHVLVSYVCTSIFLTFFSPELQHTTISPAIFPFHTVF